MNILIVSQCTKNALKESRRILDQFAERYGEKTWRTNITKIGLDTLRKLLKKTARKNTAVACHWIRGKDRTELLWIVGNQNYFDERGITPTNTTQKNILRRYDENDWHTLTDIKILASIAAIFHDFGKANMVFQKKLRISEKISEAYRHEWVSLQLFVAFVGDAKDDKDWLRRLELCNENDSINTLLNGKKTPLCNLPPLAQALGWLIVTHHFLPFQKGNSLDNNFLQIFDSNWNRKRGGDSNPSDEEKKDCMRFKEGTPFNSKAWCDRARILAKEALSRPQLFERRWLEDPFSLHLARLSLMLADHYYSSLESSPYLGDLNYPLYANTDMQEKKLKQRLDEHLIGVEKNAKKIARYLPNIYMKLSKISSLHKGFKIRSKNKAYSWQDKAYELSFSLSLQSKEHGFFGINMASTGCGKTLANARIMHGIAGEEGARFSVALGLRTLTLQTGEAYQHRLKLDSDDLAIVIGSSAIKELYNLNKENNSEDLKNDSGSESESNLLDDFEDVRYECGGDIDPTLDKWLTKNGKDKRSKKLLYSPVLVCTVDHLIGATEGTQGGKQILPMLRLLTSDLVLDEVDDFSIEDLPALSRLVYWAGLLGSRVLLSSATIAPAIAEGLFSAYLEGRKSYQKSRGIAKDLKVCCAWFDEFDVANIDCAEFGEFQSAHNHFVKKRVKCITEKSEIRRRAKIVDFEFDMSQKSSVKEIASSLRDFSYDLHRLHAVVDFNTKKKVSFGLIRFANINPLVSMAKEFFQQNAADDYHIFVCCYHSQHLLLIRNNIESLLDRLLTRHDEQAVFNEECYKKLTRDIKQENIIFIILATSVAEVGRDHDYDWAIVEPSSMRSIIQLSGRVRRHRKGVCENENIYLLETNIKNLKNKNANKKPAYYRPGFEKKGEFSLISHNLKEILLKEQYEEINSIPRILARNKILFCPKNNLVDLEQYRLEVIMLGILPGEKPVNIFWILRVAHLTAQLQKETAFRASEPTIRFASILDDNGEEKFHWENDGFEKSQDKEFKRIDIKENMGEGVQVMGYENYAEQISELAEAEEISESECAKKFGWVDLSSRNLEDHYSKEWCYNPVVGFFSNDFTDE